MPEMRREQETNAYQCQTGPHPLPHWKAATLHHVFWLHWCDDRDSNWRIFASPLLLLDTLCRYRAAVIADLMLATDEKAPA
jgi:hypothetical protein